VRRNPPAAGNTIVKAAAWPGEKGMIIVDVESAFIGSVTGVRYEPGIRYVDGRDYASFVSGNKG
jgi:hypothetical protein